MDASVLADPDQPGQSVLDDGQHVTAVTSQRLACDASRIVMRHDPDGRAVEVGARTRTITPALRRALQHRDQGCRFPGCGLPFTQGHHIRHWAQGGPTTLSTSPCCVAAIIAPCTKTASRSNGCQMASSSSGGRTAGGSTRLRRSHPCPRTPPASFARRTRQPGFSSTGGRPEAPGTVGGSAPAGRSTSCIRAPSGAEAAALAAACWPCSVARPRATAPDCVPNGAAATGSQPAPSPTNLAVRRGARRRRLPPDRARARGAPARR